MNLYPLNLVLAVAIATATLFLGYLPPRRLESPFFTRWTLWLGGMWLVVAAMTPPTILHYDVLLALIGFIAWRQLHGGHGLRGKLWLCLAAGFGISLAPVLVLAVTPGAWPEAQPAWGQALFLASIYTGGAIPGVAFALWLFTRREGIDTGVRGWNYTRLLIGLVLVRATLAFLVFGMAPQMNPGPAHVPFAETPIIPAVYLVTLLPVALGASRRLKSPRPSTAGMALSLIVIFGIAAEAMALI
jgi:hypothetical protein